MSLVNFNIMFKNQSVPYVENLSVNPDRSVEHNVRVSFISVVNKMNLFTLSS